MTVIQLRLGTNVSYTSSVKELLEYASSCLSTYLVALQMGYACLLSSAKRTLTVPPVATLIALDARPSMVSSAHVARSATFCPNISTVAKNQKQRSYLGRERKTGKERESTQEETP